MEIRYAMSDKTMHLFLDGELDEYAAVKLKDKVDSLLDESEMKYVVFELAGLTFADSTGIGFLLGRYKKLKRRNIPSFIRQPTRCVEKVFNTSGLFNVMPKIS